MYVNVIFANIILYIYQVQVSSLCLFI